MFLGVPGEFCTGWARAWACWESFVPVGPGGGCCWESFVSVGPGGGCCWESFVPVGPGGGCCWESFVPGEWWIGVGSGRKFSLLGCVVVEPGENSPCSREMAGFRCFWACWESFVPVGPGGGCCWESFVPVEPGGGCCWESFVPGEWWIGVGSGRKFSLLARNGRISLIVGVRGEFCTGWALRRACRESFVPGEWWIGVGSGRKFSLLGVVVVEPGKSSPCALEMAGFRCFWACWESFVPVGPVRGARWGRVCCVEPH